MGPDSYITISARYMRVGVLIIVLLAGCPEPNPQPTPTPEPDQPNFPPGASEEGLTEQIVTTHQQQRSNLSSFTLQATLQYDNVTGTNLPRFVQQELKLNRTSGRSLHIIQQPERTIIRFYSNGTAFHRSITPHGTFERINNSSAPTTPEDVTFTMDTLRPILNYTNETYVRKVNISNNTAFAYRNNSISQTKNQTDYRNVSIEVIVDSTGLIRRYNISYSVLINGSWRRATYQVRLGSFNNTSVPAPDWARENNSS